MKKLILAFLLICSTLFGAESGWEKYSGFLTFYTDPKTGKLYFEIDKWNQEFLYVNSLSGGVGSNDIGLDRGRLGDSRIVRFKRYGSNVLLIQSNYSYRATSDNSAEVKSVIESFAESVLWAFSIHSEETGGVIVDATDFLLQDQQNIPRALKESEQGAYKPAADRSVIDAERTKNFPLNTEIDVVLTFTGDEPGAFVRQVVPQPEIITVHQHHSFAQLPDKGYEPRVYDPRSGYNAVTFLDFSTPIGEPLQKRYIARHRLNKKDPSAAVSEPVKPIVYYLDSGTPEPVRGALLDGARWWNEAFEVIGYRNAFQIKILPADVDPMDIRYNVIQWVHRATRGWSYGASVYDPRTGEIIKGHVLLGSQRVRQDYLIAEGLLAPYESGKQVPDEMEKMALARLRQLSAHEVGHTLGLAHNYIASTTERASVMDYPHPRIAIRADGSLDLSDAYATGAGSWDKLAIAFGYQDFPAGTDKGEKLEEILQNGIRRGLIFLTDQDARPEGSAHPQAHLWDNGADAVKELEHIMKVRKIALNRFSQNNIRPGAPLATLEDVLVPIYLLHRYQIQAAAKVLGGLYYTNALREDGQQPTSIVPPQQQRLALQTLLQTIDPAFLAFPEKLLQMIPPRPLLYDRNREHFPTRAALTFDPLSAAESSANMTVSLILEPARAARLVEYHSRNDSSPGLNETIDALLSATWKSKKESGYHAEIGRVVDQVVLFYLMRLATDQTTAGQARAIAYMKLEELKQWLQKRPGATPEEKAHHQYAIARIEMFQKDAKEPTVPRPQNPPAGAPIGAD